MFKLVLLSLLLLLESGIARAQKTVYYGNDPVSVEVNSFEQTMLSFPAPAYAYSCNPSDVISLEKVENLSDYDQATLRIMQNDKKEAEKIKAKEADSTARLMKLIPVKKLQSASCIIRLADNDVIHLKISTNPDITLPGIDFRPLKKQSSSHIPMMKDENYSNIFRELIKGGTLSFLSDMTPNWGLIQKGKDTAKARYIIQYAATDGQNFTVWRVQGYSLTPFTMPESFNATPGHLIYSAAKKSSGYAQHPLHLNSGESFYIYLMGHVKLSTTDVLEMLP
ncbi:MAG: hypothetical protein H6618_05125 [Deltaproteobacteria bacterium]|nr:hypothetical protein [Deltaproteobacteria bacterium]